MVGKGIVSSKCDCLSAGRLIFAFLYLTSRLIRIPSAKEQHGEICRTQEDYMRIGTDKDMGRGPGAIEERDIENGRLERT